MKAVVVLSLLFVAGFASMATPSEMTSMWEAWKIQHGKSYSTLEENTRFGIFMHNYKKVQKFNAENETPQLGMNKFSDLTATEFKSIYATGGLYRQRPTDAVTESFEVGTLPASVDWRAKGAVTKVKDQGQCGSCWAFSTTGLLEGWNFINNGELLSFSEQQIVDCDTQDGNEGCDGGLPYNAIKYAREKGLETEAEYPYTGEDGTCRYKESEAHKITATETYVTANSTDQLKAAVVNQPVSVGIEADQDVFQMYSSGVIKTGCGANLDHAVLVVGYHKVGVLEAFIVKNSWGADWGESGYVQIWDTAAVNNGQGVCGILADPVIAKSS